MLTPALHVIASPNQYGSIAHRGIDVATLHLRLTLDYCKHHAISTAIIFVDAVDAFYNALRGTVLPTTDQLLHHPGELDDQSCHLLNRTTTHRIDHIAVPATTLPHVHATATVSDLDPTSTHQDNLLIAVHLTIPPHDYRPLYTTIDPPSPT